MAIAFAPKAPKPGTAHGPRPARLVQFVVIRSYRILSADRTSSGALGGWWPRFLREFLNLQTRKRMPIAFHDHQFMRPPPQEYPASFHAAAVPAKSFGSICATSNNSAQSSSLPPEVSP